VNVTSEKINNKNIIFFLTFILVLLVILQFYSREYIYFRDHAWFWDGILRINSGETLYKDFGVPVGPVSFYLNAYLSKIFGTNALSFHFAQIIQSTLILFFSMSILNTLEKKFSLVIWGGFFCAFLYLIFLWFPWYNSTAALFFIASIFFYLNHSKYSLYLTGVSVALAILSKHDIGILALFTIITIFIHEKFVLNKINITLSKFLLQFFFGIGLVIFLMLIFFDWQNLLYWINFGDDDKGNRLMSLTTLFRRPGIYISMILYFISLRNKSFPLLIYSMIAVSASISTITSGLSHTHFYYLFIVPAVFFHLLRLRLNYLIWTPILFFGLLSILFPIGRGYFVLENIVLDKYDHFHFNHRKNHINNISMIDLGVCVKEFRNVHVPDSICQLTNELKTKYPNDNGKILNFSELTFLPHILGMKNIIGQPLWYHTGVTFYEKERNALINALNEGTYDLIIFQPNRVPSGFPIELITHNDKYELSTNRFITPTKITKKDQNCNDCYVTYYSRKN